jgi:hypothetical protein
LIERGKEGDEKVRMRGQSIARAYFEERLPNFDSSNRRRASDITVPLDVEVIALGRRIVRKQSVNQTEQLHDPLVLLWYGEIEEI